MVDVMVVVVVVVVKKKEQKQTIVGAVVDADYKITRDAQAKDRGAKPDASGWARCEALIGSGWLKAVMGAQRRSNRLTSFCRRFDFHRWKASQLWRVAQSRHASHAVESL